MTDALFPKSDYAATVSGQSLTSKLYCIFLQFTQQLAAKFINFSTDYIMSSRLKYSLHYIKLLFCANQNETITSQKKKKKNTFFIQTTPSKINLL